MKPRKLLITSIASLFIPSSYAEDFYFKVGQIFDGNSWLSPAYIHLQDGIITYLGPFAHKGFLYKDLKESTLLPPLVDAHQHLSVFDHQYGGDYEEAFRYSHKIPIKKRKEMGKDLLNDYLHKGFLYIRDLGGDRVTLDKLKKEISNNPHYPTVQWSGRAVAHGSGQCPKDLPCSRYFQSVNTLKKGSKLETLKIYLDNEPFDGHLTQRELEEVAKGVNQPMAFHSIRPYPLKKLVQFVDKFDSLEHLTSITAFQLRAMATTSIRLVPTDMPESFIETYSDKIPPWPHEEVKIQKKRLRKLLPYINQLCFGSDFYIVPEDQVRTQAYWAVESFIQMASRLNLKPTAALKIITNQCAPLFPGEAELGHIKQGQIANFIIIEGNLKEKLSYLHNIQWVVHKGKVLINPKK